MDIRRFFNQQHRLEDKEKVDDEETQTSSEDVNHSPATTQHADASQVGVQKLQAAEPGTCDLGADKPNQIVLKNFPRRIFSGKNRSFNSDWYTGRDWLEYSVTLDAAFCYPCRMFRAPSSPGDSTFVRSGFNDWKHVIERGKGLNKHAESREHLICESMWKDKERRLCTGKEISTLVNADQLQRNRYYFYSHL